MHVVDPFLGVRSKTSEEHTESDVTEGLDRATEIVGDRRSRQIRSREQLAQSAPRIPVGGVTVSGSERKPAEAGITEFVTSKTVRVQR
jgi:hypothetical protein